MADLGTFPFGQPVRLVAQESRDRKRVFVLGVYASAVHARWLDAAGQEVVKALAVASEPSIFWRGEGADTIVRQISVPPTVGKLEAADERYNGPSGIALDEYFLRPLGVTRSDVWLCDMVPHSCVNLWQQAAIERAYLDVVRRHGLPIPSVPAVRKELCDESRRQAILAEIKESAAECLVLLGDQPIKWFLSRFDCRRRRLADFGCTQASYGRMHAVRIGAKEMAVLPLAHPRQVARLGKSSAAWHGLHGAWVAAQARQLLV